MACESVVGTEVELKSNEAISSMMQKKSTQDVCICVSARNTVALMEDAAELREKLGKTQEWIAARIKVSVSMISQYEHGKATPGLWRADLMAEEYGVSLRRMVNALKETKRRAEAARAGAVSLQAEERRQTSN
jgi:ribosome-binding protein aMBF1 (putative translation factor)